MSLNLAEPLRTAILANGPITALLAQWESEPGVHAKEIVPEDALYPLIQVKPPAAIGDMDWLNARKPLVMVDVIAYGQQPAHYRQVEQLGYLLRDLFHRNRWAISVAGHRVIQITASGPNPAPTDDERQVGRMVNLAVHMLALP